MVEMQKDPREPPRFKISRESAQGPSPPTQKKTVKDQQVWKILPCISNWTNPKGYWIPWDKLGEGRAAFGGERRLPTPVNRTFAKLVGVL